MIDYQPHYSCTSMSLYLCFPFLLAVLLAAAFEQLTMSFSVVMQSTLAQACFKKAVG